MMSLEQYLFTKLASEAVEVAHISSKVIEFGQDEKLDEYGPDNTERTHFELDDLMAIIELLNLSCGFKYTPNAERIKTKKLRVAQFLEYSQILTKVDTQEILILEKAE